MYFVSIFLSFQKTKTMSLPFAFSVLYCVVAADPDDTPSPDGPNVSAAGIVIGTIIGGLILAGTAYRSWGAPPVSSSGPEKQLIGTDLPKEFITQLPLKKIEL